MNRDEMFYSTCEGCGENLMVGIGSHLCHQCQIDERDGLFEMPPLVNIRMPGVDR